MAFGRHVASASPARPVHNVPGFTQVPFASRVTAAQNEEMAKLSFLICRERLFLYMHYLVFSGLNLVGFVLAFQCYNCIIGDPLTKTVMAGTPLLYINIPALLLVLHITGTKQHINRLKEKINYARLRMEYGHLL